MLTAMSKLVLTGARLLTGDAPPIPEATVVVEDGRIVSVAPGAATAELAAESQVVDLRGATLMPGMYSCHFHSTYHELGSQPNMPYGNEYPPSYQALIAAKNLHTALKQGYTGVVGAGGANEVEPGVAQAIKDGLIPGPRFLPSSRELSTTGHSNDGIPWHWGMPAPGAVRLCDGAEEFRRGVRDEIKKGARVIKLFVTGGHGTTAPKNRIELTRDELAAAIDAAHQREALIRAHLVNKPAIMMALELGIDIVDHCDEMDDEIIAALVETGAFVVPSLHFPKHFLQFMGSGLGFAAEGIKADLEAMYAVLPKAQAAGVRFVLGDDYGAIGFPHGAYGGEFNLYVDEAGISPLDVITWATRNGAELMGRGDDLGTVAVGKLADLLIVDGDPSADISVLADPTRITAVLKAGVVVHGALPQR
jgi:imidazolonepropionase-like amidohydrolase